MKNKKTNPQQGREGKEKHVREGLGPLWCHRIVTGRISLTQSQNQACRGKAFGPSEPAPRGSAPWFAREQPAVVPTLGQVHPAAGGMPHTHHATHLHHVHHVPRCRWQCGAQDADAWRASQTVRGAGRPGGWRSLRGMPSTRAGDATPPLLLLLLSRPPTTMPMMMMTMTMMMMTMMMTMMQPRGRRAHMHRARMS